MHVWTVQLGAETGLKQKIMFKQKFGKAQMVSNDFQQMFKKDLQQMFINDFQQMVKKALRQMFSNNLQQMFKKALQQMFSNDLQQMFKKALRQMFFNDFQQMFKEYLKQKGLHWGAFVHTFISQHLQTYFHLHTCMHEYIHNVRVK